MSRIGIRDRSSFPLRGADGARRPQARLRISNEGVFRVQQFEPGFDKVLFHQLRSDLVQLPSCDFLPKRSKGQKLK